MGWWLFSALSKSRTYRSVNQLRTGAHPPRGGLSVGADSGFQTQRPTTWKTNREPEASDSISTETHIRFEWINYADVACCTLPRWEGWVQPLLCLPGSHYTVTQLWASPQSAATSESTIWLNLPQVLPQFDSCKTASSETRLLGAGRSQLFCFVPVFPLIKTWDNLVDVGGWTLSEQRRDDQPSARRLQHKWLQQNHRKAACQMIVLSLNSGEQLSLNCHPAEVVLRSKHSFSREYGNMFHGCCLLPYFICLLRWKDELWFYEHYL